MHERKLTHVNKTCVAQSCFGISKQEIQFVLKFPGLNHTQQLVWIVLALFHANNPDFARHLSLHQLAKMLNLKAFKLWRVLLQLEVMGLVEVNKSKQFNAVVQKQQSLGYLLWHYAFESIQFLIKIFMCWIKFINNARYYRYLK